MESTKKPAEQPGDKSVAEPEKAKTPSTEYTELTTNRSSKSKWLLAVVVATILLLISCITWFFWFKPDKPTNTTNPNQNQQTNNSSNQTEEPTPDPSEEGKYLVIEEWNVRFLLPEELRGDVYHKTFTNALGEHGTVFASKKLDNLVGDGSCSFLPRPDGQEGASSLSAVLSRINPDEPSQFTMEYYRSQRTYIKKIGLSEYYYVNPSKSPPSPV